MNQILEGLVHLFLLKPAMDSNGMEKDDEFKGNGNSYDFGGRILDSRLGRWLTVDPAYDLFPCESTYSFAGNNPTYYFDPNGKWKVRWKSNDHSKGILFEAEKGDNLQTLATQMGIPYQQILDENFGGVDSLLILIYKEENG